MPSTGDLVPEVLPLGTFTWCVELRTEKERRRDMLAKSRGGSQGGTRISYLPAVVDDKRKGREWHNPVESGSGRLYGGDKVLSPHMELGDPEGSRRVRMDGETKYVQYRVTIKDGGLHEDEVIPTKPCICKSRSTHTPQPTDRFPIHGNVTARYETGMRLSMPFPLTRPNPPTRFSSTTLCPQSTR